jgi:hypothetical protein
VPDEDLEHLPVDGTAQYDRYIYGKRLILLAKSLSPSSCDHAVQGSPPSVEAGGYLVQHVRKHNGHALPKLESVEPALRHG